MKPLLTTPAARRNAALAILAVLVLALLTAAILPVWLLHRHYDSHLRDMARQRQTYTALNDSRPMMMNAVEILKARDTRKFFLKGATAALASAELQDVVKTAVESNGGRVMTTQAINHKDDGSYRQVSTMVAMSVNIQSLRRILHTLESREPYLFVDTLSVRSTVPSGFRPTPGFEPEMIVQIDVSGYAPVTEAAPAPAPAPGVKS